VIVFILISGKNKRAILNYNIALHTERKKCIYRDTTAAIHYTTIAGETTISVSKIKYTT